MRKWLSIVLLLLTVIATYAQSNDEWNIATATHDNYTGIVVANGRLGMLSSARPLEVEHVILNNVYDKESALGVSKILMGMNFGQLELEINGKRVTADNISDWQQTLDMRAAALTTSFRFEGTEVSYTLYALRQVPYSGYIDIVVRAQQDIDVRVTGKIVTPDEYQNLNSTFRVLEDLETTMPILQTVAQSRLGRHTVATSATFIWHDINSTREDRRPELTHQQPSDYNNQLTFERSVAAGDSLAFAWTAAECTTQDFADPQTESERFVIFNLLTPREVLLGQHRDRWAELWEGGDIIIEGDLTAQQDVRLALYHLYAFARADSDLSIAPMGLSSQGYNGHIFWDTELWMFPPLLALQPDIAESLLNYRSDRLEVARRKAINFGYAGAMFPWESDDTGEEATPAWALTGTFEHHITADVAIAFWNYYRVTQDSAWLTERGYPLLREVADFWVSRATENPDGSYSINNVVGANEFAPNVDDNAFTNGAAITALRYAAEAAQVLGLEPDPDWQRVANNLRIRRFPDGTTREHSTYEGERIKQADANLLAYPLDIVSHRDTIMKDLAYYEPKLAEEGPAMGKAIFSILYAQMGDAENAYRLFEQSYQPNQRPPFGALAESATSNNPYFVTGAGGMLQAILFGFGGLHITEEGIVQKQPVLPEAWESLTIKGVGEDNRTYTVR